MARAASTDLAAAATSSAAFLRAAGFLDARFLECRQLGRGGRRAVDEDSSGVGEFLLLRQFLDDFLGPAGGFGQRLGGIAPSDNLRLGVADGLLGFVLLLRDLGVLQVRFVLLGDQRDQCGFGLMPGLDGDQVVISGSFGGGFQGLGSSLQLGELGGELCRRAEKSPRAGRSRVGTPWSAPARAERL